MHTVFKLHSISKLALGKKYTMSIKSCCNLKKSLFVLLNATAESVNCSLILKHIEKHFYDLTYKKKLRQTQ